MTLWHKSETKRVVAFGEEQERGIPMRPWRATPLRGRRGTLRASVPGWRPSVLRKPFFPLSQWLFTTRKGNVGLEICIRFPPVSILMQKTVILPRKGSCAVSLPPRGGSQPKGEGTGSRAGRPLRLSFVPPPLRTGRRQAQLKRLGKVVSPRSSDQRVSVLDGGDAEQ